MILYLKVIVEKRPLIIKTTKEEFEELFVDYIDDNNEYILKKDIVEKYNLEMFSENIKDVLF